MKKCPYNRDNCTSECALYVDPEDMNEVVRNKLASLGVISRTEGCCSHKLISLSLSRHIFENTSSGFSR